MLVNFLHVSKKKFNSSPLISIEKKRLELEKLYVSSLDFYSSTNSLNCIILNTEHKISIANFFSNNELSYTTRKQLVAKSLHTWGNIASRNATQITENRIKLKEIVGDQLYASIPIKLQFPYERARWIQAYKNTKRIGRRSQT